jgi:hypothetical protein
MEQGLPCPGTLAPGSAPLVLGNDALSDCQTKSTAKVVAGVGVTCGSASGAMPIPVSQTLG